MEHLNSVKQQMAQQRALDDVYSTAFLTPARAAACADLLVFYALCAAGVVGAWLYCARRPGAAEAAKKLRAGRRFTAERLVLWQLVNVAAYTAGMALHTLKLGGGDNVPVADVAAYAVVGTLNGLLAHSVLVSGDATAACLLSMLAFAATAFCAVATSDVGHLSAYCWIASLVIAFVLVFVIGRAFVLVELPKALDELGDFAGKDQMRAMLGRLDGAGLGAAGKRRTVQKKPPRKG